MLPVWQNSGNHAEADSTVCIRNLCNWDSGKPSRVRYWLFIFCLFSDGNITDNIFMVQIDERGDDEQFKSVFQWNMASKDGATVPSGQPLVNEVSYEWVRKQGAEWRPMHVKCGLIITSRQNQLGFFFIQFVTPTVCKRLLSTCSSFTLTVSAQSKLTGFSLPTIVFQSLGPDIWKLRLPFLLFTLRSTLSPSFHRLSSDSHPLLPGPMRVSCSGLPSLGFASHHLVMWRWSHTASWMSLAYSSHHLRVCGHSLLTASPFQNSSAT